MRVKQRDGRKSVAPCVLHTRGISPEGVTLLYRVIKVVRVPACCWCSLRSDPSLCIGFRAIEGSGSSRSMMGVADESYTAARAAARREACAPVSDAFEAAAPSTPCSYVKLRIMLRRV